MKNMKKYEENMKELLSPYMERSWDLKFRAHPARWGDGVVVVFAKYEIGGR